MLEHRFEPAALPDTVIAIHVETTGGRSERRRLIWVGLSRIVGGAVEQTYETLINPRVRVPLYVSRRLGLDPTDLDAAPAAGPALGEIRSALDECPIVGHNPLEQLSQLTYELLWHGLPPLRNDLLDTQQLASERFPDLARPTLEAIARRVGLRPPRAALYGVSRHVAEVYLALAARPLEDDRAMPAPAVGRPALYAYRSLPPGAGIELPCLPGVYVFRDSLGAPLYVGKAAVLRDRVAQHFTGQSRATRLDDGLLARVSYVEHEVTTTELAALLREAELIEQLRPAYNTQRAAHAGRPFVLLRDPPFVRASAASVPLAGAESYGPYRTTRAARETIRALANVFQLRTCLRALPAKKRRLQVPCIRLGLALCPAPCAAAVTPEQYDVLVRYARVYLADGRDRALDALDARLAEDGLTDWERATLAETRSRLRRARVEHRPLTEPPLDRPPPGINVAGLSAIQRHVLARALRSPSIRRV